jgi:hypothetical protein
LAKYQLKNYHIDSGVPMSDPLSTSSEPRKRSDKLKILLIQGLIGTASLTGATAVPILVQRALSPITTPATPASVAPASVMSTPGVTTSPVPTQVAEPSPVVTPVAERETEDEDPKGKKDKRQDRRR